MRLNQKSVNEVKKKTLNIDNFAEKLVKDTPIESKEVAMTEVEVERKSDIPHLYVEVDDS